MSSSPINSHLRMGRGGVACAGQWNPWKWSGQQLHVAPEVQLSESPLKSLSIDLTHCSMHRCLKNSADNSCCSLKPVLHTCIGHGSACGPRKALRSNVPHAAAAWSCAAEVGCQGRKHTIPASNMSACMRLTYVDHMAGHADWFTEQFANGSGAPGGLVAAAAEQSARSAAQLRPHPPL